MKDGSRGWDKRQSGGPVLRGHWTSPGERGWGWNQGRGSEHGDEERI